MGAFNLRKTVEYLIYAVAFLMPLHPIAGDIALWLAVLLGIYDQIKRHEIGRPSDYISWSVLLFFVWSGISAMASVHHAWSLMSWIYQVMPGVAIYFLMSHYIKTHLQWRRFLWWFMSSALLVCIIGLIQFFAMLPNVHMQEWVDPQAFPLLHNRMASTLQNPNLLGSYLLMVLAVTGSFVLENWKGSHYKEMWKFIAFSTLIFICMVLTYSRGIWLSYVAMILYWGLIVERRMLLTLLIIPIVLFLSNSDISVRLWSLFQGHDTSSALRWALWDSTSYMIMEHPILGIGWNSFLLEYPHYNYFIQAPMDQIHMYHAHNMFINIMAETGVLGAVLFCIVLIGHMVYAVRLQGSVLKKAAHYAVGVLVIGVLVSGLSDHELYSHQIYIIFWQLLGMGAALVKARSRKGPGSLDTFE